MPGRNAGEAWRGANQAWDVIGTLLSGQVVLGGLGYVLDRIAGIQWLFLPVGMVLGMGVSIYLVYVRYGRTR